MKNDEAKNILAINTATHREEVAIVAINKSGEKDFCKVLSQSHWKSERNESSMLVKSIDSALNKAKLQYKDLGAILVITGPGPFSAIRIGCAVANALAFSLNLPTLALTTESFWKLRTSKINEPTDSSAPREILLSAGKGHFALLNLEDKNAFDPVATESNHIIYSLEEIIGHLKQKHDAKKLTLVCDVSSIEADLIKKNVPTTWTVLTEHDTKLVLPLGKALLAMPESLHFSPDDNILTPRYLRPPTITLPKKLSYVQ